MQTLRSYAKYVLKMRIVSPLRSFFLALSGVRTNRDNWENRLLIVNLQALGDLVVFTSVLKHYKKRYPGKKIYLLLKGVGIEKIFEGAFVDEVITMEYSRFAVDPLYGTKLINRLRRIGFHTVISQDFSAAEIMGRIISVNLDAKEVIGYEGLGLEAVRPFDVQQVRNLKIVMDDLFPRFTKIVPSIDVMRGLVKKIPSTIHHYRVAYEGATGVRESDYSMEFPARVYEGASETLAKFGLTAKAYAVLNVNASMPFKRWPLERFREVAALLRARGFVVALVGSRGEMPLVGKFKELAGADLAGSFIDLSGRTTIRELIQVVANAHVVVTNDTSLVHFSVATKAPMLAITALGTLGMFSDFGYPDIHRWVYQDRACSADNWECSRTIGDRPAPCLEAVTTAAVLEKLKALLGYLEAQKNTTLPLEKFNEGYLPETTSAGTNAPTNHGAKYKIIYAGIQGENYRLERFPSFERENFYETLAHMKDVSVIEFPFDPIIGVGKRWWNKKLLELVEKEKPDCVFAFMLSDEFDPGTLDAIKKITVSFAWFADDQWRIPNYSRHWAPHFTHAVTTWSKGPAKYARYGVTNIIRSQWAANPMSGVVPASSAKQDIPISFVGQRTSVRARIIADLADAGIVVATRGLGWPEGRVTSNEKHAIIARSKINLNLNVPLSRFNPRALGRIFVQRSRDRLVLDFHWINNAKSWWCIATPQVKARPFEMLAEDAFVISPHADDMERYYEDKKEIVYYDGTVQDLAKKIKYYLEPNTERTEERRRIAHAGYERTLREHAYTERFSKFLFSKR